MSARGVVGLCLASAFLAGGCASTPGPARAGMPVPGEVQPAPDAPVSSFEQGLRDRAALQSRQGRLADAALSWEILTVLRPGSADYRDRLADLRRQIDKGVAWHLAQAAEAGKHADIDKAAAHYLATLALQPDNAQAVEALRQIERERNKRNLGRPSRVTLTKRADKVPP